MMKVKIMLTEVLLSVTNEEISSVCKSVYSKCKKRELAGRLIYKQFNKWAMMACRAIGHFCCNTDTTFEIGNPFLTLAMMKYRIKEAITKFDTSTLFLHYALDQRTVYDPVGCIIQYTHLVGLSR